MAAGSMTLFVRSSSSSFVCSSPNSSHQAPLQLLSGRHAYYSGQQLRASCSYSCQLPVDNLPKATKCKQRRYKGHDSEHYPSIFAGRKNHGNGERQKSKDRRRWSSKGTEISRKVRIASTIDNVARQKSGFLPPDVITLEEGQAIGQVVSAQANFMKVLITKCAEPIKSPSDRLNDIVPLVNRSLQVASGSSVHGHLHQQDNLNLEDNFLFTSDFDNAGSWQPRIGVEVLCVVRALLKKLRRKVLVGDVVSLEAIDWAAKRGMIEDVFPRKSQIVDPPIANVDHVLLLFSLSKPPMDPINLSRFLVAAEATDVPFTLALNKVDLVEPEVLSEWRSRLQSWGYNPYCCSVHSGMGISALENLMIGKVSVVAGPSGVGKSSLINAIRVRREGSPSGSLMGIHQIGLNLDDLPGGLVRDSSEEEDTDWVLVNYDSNSLAVAHCAKGGDEGLQNGWTGGPVSGPEEYAVEGLESTSADEEHGYGYGWSQLGEDLEASWQMASDRQQFVELRVGEVSDRSGRGRHTTRHVELLRLPNGGLLADTPGFSQPSLATVSSHDLPLCFPEIRVQLESSEDRCTFSDCQHLGEPGCVMHDDWERFRQYSQLLEEVKRREEAEKHELGTKRESDVRYKSGASGVKTAEPRLSLKKHRRESRKQGKQSLETFLWEEDMDAPKVTEVVVEVHEESPVASDDGSLTAPTEAR